MLKSKRPINVGDEIIFVEGLNTFRGEVFTVSKNENVFSVNSPSFTSKYVHRRQIIKVIRKKKKREPRVVVETQWGADGLNKCLHFSEDSAINFMQTERPGVQYKLVKFVEVLES